MHPSTLLLALAAALTTATEIIPGYTIVPIDWEIEVSPGKIATLNGTVQEVIAQAQAINPGFALQGVSPKPASAAAKLRRRGQQSRRGPLSRRGVDFCNHFGNADVDAILEGVDYLHRLGGSANMKAGPRVCSRISCSYNSAIYACNDVSVLSLDFGGGGVWWWWRSTRLIWWESQNSGPKSVTFNGLANSAAHITEICPWHGADVWRYTSGQNFEQSSWNTIVREDNC